MRTSFLQEALRVNLRSKTDRSGAGRHRAVGRSENLAALGVTLPSLSSGSLIQPKVSMSTDNWHGLPPLPSAFLQSVFRLLPSTGCGQPGPVPIQETVSGLAEAGKQVGWAFRGRRLTGGAVVRSCQGPRAKRGERSGRGFP